MPAPVPVAQSVTVTQALVAIGGQASRLRADGVKLARTKAFMVSGRRPLLYWCLESLRLAGITDVVLAGDKDEHLERGLSVAERVMGFNSVKTFKDEGAGVHGIPSQASALLQEVFLFEAGHGVSHPRHYRRMIEAKAADAVVFSAFVTNPVNPRYRTDITAEGLCVPGDGWALAHPMVIDMGYVARLAEFGFDVSRIADDYRDRGALRAVRSDLPPEFDLAAEFQLCLELFRNNRGRRPDGMPWGRRRRTAVRARRRGLIPSSRRSGALAPLLVQLADLRGHPALALAGGVLLHEHAEGGTDQEAQRQGDHQHRLHHLCTPVPPADADTSTRPRGDGRRSVEIGV
jgi:hypothetical protein